MSENELYKATYMQNPFTLLTEQNLEKLEEHCKKSIHFERGIEHKVTLELLDRYRELESEKAKLIEKLEEDIKENNFRETECLEDKGRYYYAQEILQILKGENDE